MAEVECPKCGKTGFSDKSYMKRHHKLVHGESLRQKFECSLEGCENKSYNPKFCSQECLGKARRKYEKSQCQAESCGNKVYKLDYCSHKCANRNSWRERDNPSKRPEVRQKISEKQQGEKNSFYGKSHTEEALQKISESTSGEKHHLHGVTGKDHPSYGIASGLKLQRVEKTGHTVRSNWEREIDLMLHKSELDYSYESEVFALPGNDTYTPDFLVKDQVVIEVKGWADEKSKQRARLFMQEYPEHRYIVVGNRLPCDKFVEWKNRKKLIEIIREEKI